jgi:hypothetical protein
MPRITLRLTMRSKAELAVFEREFDMPQVPAVGDELEEAFAAFEIVKVTAVETGRQGRIICSVCDWDEVDPQFWPENLNGDYWARELAKLEADGWRRHDVLPEENSPRPANPLG